MDRQKRMALVQFWMVVDGLRNPLEDDIAEDETLVPQSLTWNSSDRNDFAQIQEKYLSIPELKIPEKSKQFVKSFLKAGKNATPLQYLQARGAILRAQTATYDEMQNNDLPKFKKSDLFFKYLASDDLATSSSNIVLSPPTRSVSPIKDMRRTSSSPQVKK